MNGSPLETVSGLELAAVNDGAVVRTRLAQGVAANLIGRPAQMAFELAASVLVARFLGPELLATLVTIRALASTASAVGDLGITWSIPKIMPDLAASGGREEALRVVRQLTVLRLVTVPLVGLACYLMAQAGWIGFGKIELSNTMAAAALVLAAVTMLNSSRRYVILSALRLRDILYLDIMAAFLGPSANIVAVVLTRDPLIVALSGLAAELAVCIILHFAMSYDLDGAKIAAPRRHSIGEVARRYGPFVTMMYAKFVFNRTILRNPMLVIVLALLGASPAEVGNAAVALSLAFRAWELANVPLSQMRAPMLARLHVRKDAAGMRKLESVSVAVVTLSSCLLAVMALACGESVVVTVYGPAYADAARLAGVACAFGLIANVFSLGNNTLQQLENYRAQVLGMGLALVAVGAGVTWLQFSAINLEMTMAALLLLILVRTVFWLLTDITADRTVFGFAYTSIKWRGIAAAALPMALAVWIEPRDLVSALGFAGALAVVFLVLMRLLGGIGGEARGVLQNVLSARFHPLLRWV